MKLMAMLNLVPFVLVVGCPPPTPPEPPLDPNDPSATCDTACENMRAMGCTGWLSTPKGGYCVDVCKNAAANAIAWPVSCLSASKSCDEANRCR